MDKKLEARIARLERLLSKKNEDAEHLIAYRKLQAALEKIEEIMNSLDDVNELLDEDSVFHKIYWPIHSALDLGRLYCRRHISDEFSSSDEI